MNDLFLHDSLDTSPIVFSDRILTPRRLLRRLLFYICRRSEVCRQRERKH